MYIISAIIPICIYPHIRSASSRSVRSQGMTLQWHDLEEVYPTKGAAINIVSCISYHAISLIYVHISVRQEHVFVKQGIQRIGSCMVLH